MSNCYKGPRQGEETAVKIAFSAAEKAKSHWVERSSTEYRAGERSTTHTGGCISKHSIIDFSSFIFSSDFLNISFFFSWLLFFFLRRITIHTLQKYLNGEANSTILGDRTLNLGVQQQLAELTMSSKDWKAGSTQHPKQWGLLLPWCTLAAKLAKHDHLRFPSNFSIYFKKKKKKWFLQFCCSFPRSLSHCSCCDWKGSWEKQFNKEQKGRFYFHSS